MQQEANGRPKAGSRPSDVAANGNGKKLHLILFSPCFLSCFASLFVGSIELPFGFPSLPCVRPSSSFPVFHGLSGFSSPFQLAYSLRFISPRGLFVSSFSFCLGFSRCLLWVETVSFLLSFTFWINSLFQLPLFLALGCITTYQAHPF